MKTYCTLVLLLALCSSTRGQMGVGVSFIELQKERPGGEFRLSDDGGYSYTIIDTTIMSAFVYRLDAAMNSRGLVVVPGNKFVLNTWRDLLNESDVWKRNGKNKWVCSYENGTMMQCEIIKTEYEKAPQGFEFKIVR